MFEQKDDQVGFFVFLKKLIYEMGMAHYTFSFFKKKGRIKPIHWEL
jgi:hypothetical protein